MKKILLPILFLLISPINAAPLDAYQVTSQQFSQIDQDVLFKKTKLPIYTYKIIKTYSHNTNNFTEGLAYSDGYLYESTGRYGLSKLIKMDLTQEKIVQSIDLDPKYFGEGIAIIQKYIFQLTWISNAGFVYDRNSFKLLTTFHYPSQGWGLTTDGKDLIMSNGSSALLYIDPQSLQVKKYLLVTAEKQPLGMLNALQYVDGYIYANIHETNLIAKISVQTGEVVAWIDMTGLNPNPIVIKPPFNLNGIAYDTQQKKLLVTGKGWPYIYAIDLVPKKKGWF